MAEYVIMPKADYESACDATRAKTGKTDLIKSGELGTEIGGITVGSNIPDGTNVTFGVVERPKAYYNGVLLPAIPEDVLEQYPYAWIRNNDRTGYYDLLLSSSLWYAQDSDTIFTDGYSAGGIQWYHVAKSDTEAAWVFNQAWTSSGGFGNQSDRRIMWSNHDIPNGSADAAEIYFEGTEPQIVPVFPEREEAYSFTSEDIANLGYAIQQKTNDYTLRTVAEYTDRVKDIAVASDIPDGTDVDFGVTQEPIITHAFYNGVRLPVLSAEMNLNVYPFVFIFGRLLYLSRGQPYWEANEDSGGGSITLPSLWQRYRSEDGNTWTAYGSGSSGGASSSGDITWSNHDIPYDSEDSTNIYLRGTEPIEDLNAPEKEPVYSFPSEVIDQLAYAIQQKTNDYTLSTVSEYTDRVNDIEQYETETKTISPDFSTGDMVVTPTDGSLLSEVTIQKPDTLLPENIALGVNIAGVVGTLEAGTSDDVRYVTFMNGETVLYVKPVAVGDDCVDVVSKGLIETPTKEADAQYTYTYYGWGASDGGAADSTILQNITEDKTVYAIFTAAVRYYTITYLDDDGVTVLNTQQVAYGSTPSYTPTADGKIFDAWTPALATVTGDATYTASWIEVIGGAYTDTINWTLEDGVLTFSGTGKMTDWNYANFHNAPFWQYNDNITKVVVEDGITHVGAYTFNVNYTNITEVVLADSVQSLGALSFYQCSKLASINIPEGITEIPRSIFSSTALTSLTLPSSITTIRQSAFAQSDITTITIPSAVTLIERTVFYKCYSLTSITFEETSGWFYADSASATSGTSIAVTSATQNVTNLVSSYYNKYFIRSAS